MSSSSHTGDFPFLNKKLEFVVVLLCVTLLSAWAFQFFGRYVPCQLCLLQRWPYYFAIPLGGFLVWRKRCPPKNQLGMLLLCLTLLISTGLGAYHAGIEWSLWAGPSSCAGTSPIGGAPLPDLTVRIVSCTQAPWRFGGLSFAGWNAVISFIAFVLACLEVTDKQQRKHSVEQK